MNDDFPFVRYDKIAESPAAWGLDEAAARALGKEQWVVTEKIHGANVCFLSDGALLRCAKRKALLAEDDPFFNWRAVRDAHRDVLMATIHAILTAHPDASHALVYGELFGGGYPHDDVAPVQGVEPIQTGVWYAPGVLFCAFDLAIVRDGDGATRTFLPLDAARSIAHHAGLMWAEPLFVGSLADAQSFAVGFDTTLPARLGLPAMPSGSNAAEGVVLKPMSSLEISTADGRMRPVLKHKIPSFSEDARFAGAHSWSAPAPRTGLALDVLEWEMMARVNTARIASAISKVGRWGDDQDPAWLEAVVGEVAHDVRSELLLHELWAELAEEDRALLDEALRDEARGVLAQRSI